MQWLLQKLQTHTCEREILNNQKRPNCELKGSAIENKLLTHVKLWFQLL